MRVLLLNPPGPEGRGYIREGRCEQRLSAYAYSMLPVSLPLTAGLLRERGHEVRILDAVAAGTSTKGVLDEVAGFSPGLVIVAVSTPTYDSDVAWIDRLSTVVSAHFSAIGVHVTALPDETLRSSPLHSVIRGEPEWTTASLADALQSGQGLGHVAGLSWRDGPRVVHNEDYGFDGDLDELPPPARDLLDERNYFLPLIDRPYTLVVPSRGCPHHCTYCTAPMYYGKRLRRRSPAKVVDEIESVAKRGVVNDFVMWSDTFTLDRSFVLALSDELRARKLGIRWSCNSRVDSLDEEMIGAMKAAGCTGVAFGIESGVQQILDSARKGTTVEQGREAIRLTREAGVQSLAHFILGLPGETPETIRQTIDYAKDIDPDFAQFYCATPLPGTKLREQALEHGSLPTLDRWSELEFNRAHLSTPSLPARALQRARVRAYVEFYGRPKVVARTLAQSRPKHLARLARQAMSFARDWVLGG